MNIHFIISVLYLLKFSEKGKKTTQKDSGN